MHQIEHYMNICYPTTQYFSSFLSEKAETENYAAAIEFLVAQDNWAFGDVKESSMFHILFLSNPSMIGWLP